MNACRSHIEPITMAILSMFHLIVNRRFESGSWQELNPLFSVLFYIRYDIFCAVLRRVWHFLCCIASGMAFSVLFYVGYGIFDENVSPSVSY